MEEHPLELLGRGGPATSLISGVWLPTRTANFCRSGPALWGFIPRPQDTRPPRIPATPWTSPVLLSSPAQGLEHRKCSTNALPDALHP